jgi:hypothetical protein
VVGQNRLLDGGLAIVSSGHRDETIRGGHETISRFRADIRKQQMVINPATKRRTTPAAKPGDSQMKTLSFILAFAFVLACPALAGNSDAGQLGIGTFAYSGSPIAASSPHAVVIATR